MDEQVSRAAYPKLKPEMAALLPKLIAGQIRVRDAEKFLEERGL